MNQNPVFLLAGNGPYANRGCEAIVRGTVEMLSDRFPGASYILSSVGDSARQEADSEIDSRIRHKPHIMRKPRPLSAWERWKQRITRRPAGKKPQPEIVEAELEAMSEADCALILGGDTFSLDYGRPTTYLDISRALVSTGKPVVLWGASVGPFTKDPEFEAMMSRYLKEFALIMARETQTQSYLASIGVEENVRLVAEPAFLMRPAEPVLPEDLREFIDRRPIGLNFSPLAALYYEGGTEKWTETVTGCIAATMEKTGMPVLLIPHVTIDTWIDNDHTFLLDAGQRVGQFGTKLRILPSTLSAAEYKWVISKLSVFAGARMHATIAAFSTCVPTLSLGYSQKSRGINEDLFGHQEWLLRVDQLDPASFAQAVTRLLTHREDVVRRLNEAIPAVLDRARSAAEHVAALIAEPSR